MMGDWAESDTLERSDANFTYIDLFAGIGGFHAALSALGGKCVYVSEIDDHAKKVYERNWGKDVWRPDRNAPMVHGDINIDAPQRDVKTGRADGPVRVPKHEVLAAGFPCQSFSKSGAQLGTLDKTRGTLFFNIIRILQERTPKIVFLENVRNLAGPKHTETWDTIMKSLETIGYEVAYAPMVVSPHFISPENGGAPQVRERVFILGIYKGEGRKPAKEVKPTFTRGPVDGWDPQSWSLEHTPLPWLGGKPILQQEDEIDHPERYGLSEIETRWIDVWDDFVRRMRAHKVAIPGHPLWTEYFVTESQLDHEEVNAMPDWKSDFVWKNVRFYQKNRSVLDQWLAAAREQGFDNFPPSRRKFEWQAQDAETLWECIMHLRPSGIRAKKPTYVPALVAITQTSIVGSRRRRLTPVETARLQGLPDTFDFGAQPEAQTYKQLGNGVNAGAVYYAMREFVKRYADELRDDLPGLVNAVLGPDATTWPVITPAKATETEELTALDDAALVGVA